MQVFWSILQQTITAIVVLDRVHRKRLKSAPANRNDQRISSLENALVPTMLFETGLEGYYNAKKVFLGNTKLVKAISTENVLKCTHLEKAHLILAREKTTENDGISSIKVGHKLTGHLTQLKLIRTIMTKKLAEIVELI